MSKKQTNKKGLSDSELSQKYSTDKIVHMGKLLEPMLDKSVTIVTGTIKLPEGSMKKLIEEELAKLK